MNYMILYLLICVILGLWLPPKAKAGYIVAVLAVLLVAFFLIAPRHM